MVRPPLLYAKFASFDGRLISGLRTPPGLFPPGLSAAWEQPPGQGLVAGDVGTVVLVHCGGEGYEVEFVALDGETVAVATVRSSQVQPILPMGPTTRGHMRESPVRQSL